MLAKHRARLGPQWASPTTPTETPPPAKRPGGDAGEDDEIDDGGREEGAARAVERVAREHIVGNDERDGRCDPSDRCRRCARKREQRL